MNELTLTAEIPIHAELGANPKVTWQVVGPLSRGGVEDRATNERFLRAIGRGLVEAGFAVTLTRTTETREAVDLNDA